MSTDTRTADLTCGDVGLREGKPSKLKVVTRSFVLLLAMLAEGLFLFFKESKSFSQLLFLLAGGHRCQASQTSMLLDTTTEYPIGASKRREFAKPFLFSKIILVRAQQTSGGKGHRKSILGMKKQSQGEQNEI